jgi:protein O-mannosyl-transferase
MRRKLLACAALIIVTLAVYSPVRNYGFVAYDDPLYVDHPRVREGLSLANIGWALRAGDAANWHPATWISYMLDVQFFGPRAGPMHVTNVLLHAINAALVFLAFSYITGALWRPLAAAALFALHPLRVESVAWVAERKDVLCATFFLLAVWSYAWYAHQPTCRRYAAVLAASLLALMSKPMAVTLPCVLLLLDFWPLGRWQLGRPWGKLVAEKLPLVALVIASAIVTVLAQSRAGAVRAGTKYSFVNRLANVPVAYAGYVSNTAVPTKLAVFYPHPGRWPASIVVTTTLGVLLVTAAAFLARRRAPYITVGWLWFLGTLVPVIGIVQVGMQWMADRYTYIPGIGLCVIVGFTALDPRWPVVARRVVAGVIIAVLVGMTLMTSRQMTYWTGDSLALFGHALAVTDRNWLAHGYVGSALVERRRIEEGRYHLARAIEINPAYPEGHYNWGNLLLHEGRHADAADAYETALRLRPSFVEAMSHLGVARAAQGRWAEAERHLRDAIAARPDFADAHANLGVALEKQGRRAEAIAEFHEALRLRPNFSLAQQGLQRLESNAAGNAGER